MEKYNRTTGGVDSPTSLQSLITDMVDHSQSAAVHNHTHVVNEVARNIELDPSMVKAAAVIEDILKTVIGNSRNGEIHITADRYRDLVVIEVQERNNYNGYALAFSIGSIEPAALSLGGHISIKGQQQKVATISFSFPTSLQAA